MALVEPVIRPPSEADSFLLQVTLGCSSNTCTFCGAYLNKPFQVKPIEEIQENIRQATKFYPQTRRVFLLDGDALVLSNQKLIPVLNILKEAFPMLTRVSSYANGCNITKKTDQELAQLSENKLRLMYIGLESGNQEILDDCCKRSSAEEMAKAVNRLENAGIKSSVIVLLGLGGKAKSEQHVNDTAKILNKMQPRYLSFLSLMLVPGTQLSKEARQGRFKALNCRELLRQAHDIIAGLELKGTIFRCDHASNYLSLQGRFPQDKEYLLNMFDQAVKDNIPLKPEIFRGL
ncbi:MAG: radical SAM protein [Candidatus Omnitrophica bacterium]|nr:radical SAM protein [Candidatus Omnitrophota bacterium]